MGDKAGSLGCEWWHGYRMWAYHKDETLTHWWKRGGFVITYRAWYFSIDISHAFQRDIIRERWSCEEKTEASFSSEPIPFSCAESLFQSVINVSDVLNTIHWCSTELEKKKKIKDGWNLSTYSLAEYQREAVRFPPPFFFLFRHGVLVWLSAFIDPLHLPQLSAASYLFHRVVELTRCAV